MTELPEEEINHEEHEARLLQLAQLFAHKREQELESTDREAWEKMKAVRIYDRADEMDMHPPVQDTSTS